MELIAVSTSRGTQKELQAAASNIMHSFASSHMLLIKHGGSTEETLCVEQLSHGSASGEKISFSELADHSMQGPGSFCCPMSLHDLWTFLLDTNSLIVVVTWYCMITI